MFVYRDATRHSRLSQRCARESSEFRDMLLRVACCCWSRLRDLSVILASRIWRVWSVHELSIQI